MEIGNLIQELGSENFFKFGKQKITMNSILIQTDFDNTITEGNVSELIHDEFGPENWPEIYEKYKKDLITVEESNIYSFRYLNKDPHHYSWWSYRANSRAKNLGWRIDYNMISRSLLPKLKLAHILSKVKHSDHCPVLLEIAETS